jgi:hypothetical protein
VRHNSLVFVCVSSVAFVQLLAAAVLTFCGATFWVRKGEGAATECDDESRCKMLALPHSIRSLFPPCCDSDLMMTRK